MHKCQPFRPCVLMRYSTCQTARHVINMGWKTYISLFCIYCSAYCCGWRNTFDKEWDAHVAYSELDTLLNDTIFQYDWQALEVFFHSFSLDIVNCWAHSTRSRPFKYHRLVEELIFRCKIHSTKNTRRTQAFRRTRRCSCTSVRPLCTESIIFVYTFWVRWCELSTMHFIWIFRKWRVIREDDAFDAARLV